MLFVHFVVQGFLLLLLLLLLLLRAAGSGQRAAGSGLLGSAATRTLTPDEQGVVDHFQLPHPVFVLGHPVRVQRFAGLIDQRLPD